MFIDILGTDAINGMPVLIAATAGTQRHALMLDHAMRPLFAYLRAVVVPTGVFRRDSGFRIHRTERTHPPGRGRTRGTDSHRSTPPQTSRGTGAPHLGQFAPRGDPVHRTAGRSYLDRAPVDTFTMKGGNPAGGH